jgi:hypothetical protein
MTAPSVLHLGVHGADVAVDAATSTPTGKPPVQIADTARDESAGG